MSIWKQVSREAATPPAHLRSMMENIAIIRDHRRPPSPHATYSNSCTTMRVYFKVNKLSLMPNLRRPVNNASSRNYLNACNWRRYDLLRRPTSLSHPIRYMPAITLYRLQLTQPTIRRIDCAYKTLFLVAVISVPYDKTRLAFVLYL